MSVQELTQATFDSEVSNGVALIEFWAPWCGPCRAMAPIIAKLSDQFSGQAKVAKVDIEDQPDLVSRFSIQSIPFTIILKDGQTVKSFVGSQRIDVLSTELAKAIL